MSPSTDCGGLCIQRVASEPKKVAALMFVTWSIGGVFMSMSGFTGLRGGVYGWRYELSGTSVNCAWIPVAIFTSSGSPVVKFRPAIHARFVRMAKTFGLMPAGTVPCQSGPAIR